MSLQRAFIKNIIEKAKKDPKHIVFPEGEDTRILEAAHVITKEKIAKITILGDEDKISNFYDEKGYSKENISIVDPTKSHDIPHFVELFYILRKHKGISIEQAKEFVKQNNYFGTLLVYDKMADALISGASHSTADTVRPALQIIKASRKTSIVSSMFFMCFDEKTLIFADCGLVEDPNDKQLADMAIQSALTALQFDIEPAVALLSYSTKGSAESQMTNKIVRATKIAQEKIAQLYPDLPIKIDGELQGDAAIVPSVAIKKCPGSILQGNAKVLVFPDLNAGNIAYKLVQRLCGASAFGPILQGLKRPVNDLSRGCSIDDIVGVTAITVVQCQQKENE
ncbi:MAG: phosphate acetyltransferase [Candidatus Aureabacteria bacterium]|nr:phosphate acetyltransferase [Candidatus Auribacterota bacterium]